MLANPFVIYVISFGLVATAYQLQWSEIYPELSLSLLLFLLTTFLLSLMLAIYIKKDIKRNDERPHASSSMNIQIPLIAAFVLDIIYQGEIPLVSLISGADYNYTNFGIPVLHVAIITLGGVFSTQRFCEYLKHKDLHLLLQAITPIAYDLLIVNRGAALIALVSWFFVFVIEAKNIGLRKILLGTLVLILSVHLFGAIGDLRSGEGVIELIGKPSESFSEFNMPKSYFWTYIYATSPMANLQESINNASSDSFGIIEFISSEMMPDFISKRIFYLFDINSSQDIFQIDPALNVGTMYARSFIYYGWIGMVALFIWLSILVISCAKFMKPSRYQTAALALLNTLVVFCIFDNMIVFSGISLQLVFLALFRMREVNVLRKLF